MATPPGPSAAYSPPSRPLGVAILAVLVGLFGVLWIVLGILILAGVAAFAFLSAGGLPGVLGLTGLVAGAIVLGIGLVILGLALGLWHLRLWALVLTLIVVAVGHISDGLAGAYASLGFVLGAILFVYLLAVNRHFR